MHVKPNGVGRSAADGVVEAASWNDVAGHLDRSERGAEGTQHLAAPSGSPRRSILRRKRICDNPYLHVCYGLTTLTVLSLVAMLASQKGEGSSREPMQEERHSEQRIQSPVDRLRSPLVWNNSMSGLSMSLTECGEGASQATPWLLPPRTPCLPYTDMTNLLELAEHRAKPKGRYKKAVSVAFFSANLAEMTQNAVYSMVRFGGVDNYLLATWTPEDLAVCQELNFPCKMKKDVALTLDLVSTDDDCCRSLGQYKCGHRLSVMFHFHVFISTSFDFCSYLNLN